MDFAEIIHTHIRIYIYMFIFNSGDIRPRDTVTRRDKSHVYAKCRARGSCKHWLMITYTVSH